MNISTRGTIQGGGDMLVAGFVISGGSPKRVLVRGVGPTLANFGVPDAMGNPALAIYAAGGSTPVAQNDDWENQSASNGSASISANDITTAGSAVGAFPLGAGARDSALIVTLSPGAYSAIETGVNGSTGEGLIEVYELPEQ
jgi:type IV secretory pathway TrbL component